MKKAVIIFSVFALVAIAIVFTLMNVETRAIPEPSVSIKIGDQAIKPIYYGDRYNETREDIERFLDFPFEEGSWEALPYVDIGDEVSIRFENFEANSVSLVEDLLNQEGKYLYNEKSSRAYDVAVKDGEIRFELPSNPAVHLSSNSESYKPGHVIRAFVIRAEINGSDFAFAFVIRTNLDLVCTYVQNAPKKCQII